MLFSFNINIIFIVRVWLGIARDNNSDVFF
nr:MAG TPA: hypothetical protein [Caudoviricetes sp.]